MLAAAGPRQRPAVQVAHHLPSTCSRPTPPPHLHPRSLPRTVVSSATACPSTTSCTASMPSAYAMKNASSRLSRTALSPSTACPASSSRRRTWAAVPAPPSMLPRHSVSSWCATPSSQQSHTAASRMSACRPRGFSSPYTCRRPEAGSHFRGWGSGLRTGWRHSRPAQWRAHRRQLAHLEQVGIQVPPPPALHLALLPGHLCHGGGCLEGGAGSRGGCYLPQQLVALRVSDEQRRRLRAEAGAGAGRAVHPVRYISADLLCASQTDRAGATTLQLTDSDGLGEGHALTRFTPGTRSYRQAHAVA